MKNNPQFCLKCGKPFIKIGNVIGNSINYICICYKENKNCKDIECKIIKYTCPKCGSEEK